MLYDGADNSFDIKRGLQSICYGIYGELLSGDKTQTGYLYNGAYGVHTDNNGLYYMRARYYNADISRFINQDILTGTPTASQSLNRYAYCQGNPINQNDPFGLCPQGMTTRDWIHLGLSIAGCIPYVGIVANAVNAGMYFAEGDILNGVLSLAGSLIGAGKLATTLGAVKNSCTALQMASGIEKAGHMMVTAAMADMTIMSAAKTLVLLHDNDYALNGEILMAAGETVLSAMGTMGALSAIDECTRETQRLLENATCFAAGTQVLTDEGLKNIEDIEAGDYVYSTNEETGESGYKEVLQVFENETEVIIHVYYEDKEGNTHEIETTLYHPFWSEGEWKSAGALQTGDLLTLADGTQVAVSDITYEDRHTVVYNMEVAEYHTYYVGEQSVWVHNTCTKQTLNVGAGVVGSSNPDDVYAGVKEASQYLKDMGLPRNLRKDILESFDVRTIKVEQAGANSYGIRFYGGNAKANGPYLFETFTPQTNRSNLALPPDWNDMSGIKQWKIMEGTTIFTGRAAPQLQFGSQYVGGAKQIWVPNPKVNLVD